MIFIFEKGYGFFSFAKNIDKNLSCWYGPNLIDHSKQTATDAPKTTLKGVIQKTTEASGHKIDGNKIWW